MQQVQNGNTIQIHYKGSLNDGTIFDSSEGKEPLEFTVGNGQVIKGFDEGVLNMSVGEKKSINIPAENAYGNHDATNMVEFPLSEFPADMKPEVGMELHLNDDNGNVIPVIIAELKENSVVLDGNHPLAGKDLNFDLELVTILS